MSDHCKTCEIAGYGCAQCPHFDKADTDAGYQRAIRELSVRVLHYQERAEAAEEDVKQRDSTVLYLKGFVTAENKKASAAKAEADHERLVAAQAVSAVAIIEARHEAQIREIVAKHKARIGMEREKVAALTARLERVAEAWALGWPTCVEPLSEALADDTTTPTPEDGQS